MVFPCEVPFCHRALQVSKSQKALNSMRNTQFHLTLMSSITLQKNNLGLLYFRCNICGKEFYEKALFRRHVKKATHGKKGRAKQNLERVCDQCGRKFTQLREYRRHMNNHEGSVYISDRREPGAFFLVCQLFSLLSYYLFLHRLILYLERFISVTEMILSLRT